MYKERAGRHYWFAENLINKGYKPTVFCASTIHNSNEVIKIKTNKYTTKISNGIPFNFVQTPQYNNNGLLRIKNMFTFYKNLFSVTKKYAKKNNKPDVIIASSVHPLTLIAGIKIAKKFDVPCICEIRDLWPESLVAYDVLKRNSIITKLLYAGEKWIYKNADSIIMTWEGGKDYILDQGWDKDINIEKITHISNGVVLDTFDKNSQQYIEKDIDLDNKNFKNIVYTGSIRKVNNIKLLLDAAKIIQDKDILDIRLLIYGDGDEREELEEISKKKGIDNILFKGKVNKKYIPSILKKSYINILHNSSTSLDKYGQSQNKFFEYLAAGKSIIQTYTTGYSICEKYNCGYSVQKQTPEEIAKTIIKACSNDKENQIMGENARETAHQYDFNILTDELIKVIDNSIEKYII